MKRLLLAAAIIVSGGVVGCNKGPDSAGGGAGGSAGADSSRAGAAPAGSSTAVSIPSDTAAVAAAADTAVAGSDVTGAYMMIGKVPVDFAEIEHLGLATIDDQGKPAPLNGFIRPKMSSAKDYRLIAPKMTGRALAFTTEEVGGISYSFTGHFTKLGNFPANPPAADAPVLEGTLTRLRDGKITAMTSASFTYSAGG